MLNVIMLNVVMPNVVATHSGKVIRVPSLSRISGARVARKSEKKSRVCSGTDFIKLFWSIETKIGVN
jgi:hypothetical protein